MISSRLKFQIFNLLGLEITWAACAYGAIKDMESVGILTGLAYIVIHFILTKTHFEDLFTLIIVSSIGILVDSINAQYNLIFFNSISDPFLIPYWLIILWFVFSLMIPHCLYWLSKNLTIAAIIGGIGGSFSYWLGHKLGALTLADPLLTSVIIYFFQWSILFPVALLVTKSLFRLRNKAQTIQ